MHFKPEKHFRMKPLLHRKKAEVMKAEMRLLLHRKSLFKAMPLRKKSKKLLTLLRPSGKDGWKSGVRIRGG